MIIKRIKNFFINQSNLLSLAYNETRSISHQVFSLHQLQREMFKRIIEQGDIGKQLAAITKRLSSIEMEMLIQRGACLDNNFEGKQDM